MDSSDEVHAHQTSKGEEKIRADVRRTVLLLLHLHTPFPPNQKQSVLSAHAKVGIKHRCTSQARKGEKFERKTPPHPSLLRRCRFSFLSFFLSSLQIRITQPSQFPTKNAARTIP